MLATVANTRAFVMRASSPLNRRAMSATRVFAAEEERVPVAPVEEPAPMAEATPVAESTVTAAVSATPTLGDSMAFSGPIPEVVNGRLAMVAIVAALASEFSSDESVLTQFGDAPVGVFALVLLTTIASFVPVLKGAKSEAFGPFTAAAELANGRAAMLGLAFLLVIEGGIHKALF